MADESIGASKSMEPILPVVEANEVVATSEPVIADQHGPTSLAQYWKLDPWSQGYVVALEAERCQSGERPSQPLPEALARRGQWRTGHLSGRLAGTE